MKKTLKDIEIKHRNRLIDNEVEKVKFPYISRKRDTEMKGTLLVPSVGSCKFSGKQCKVCLNVTETKIFSSAVTKKEYKINHKFHCNDKCLIYLLTRNKWMFQYVG